MWPVFLKYLPSPLAGYRQGQLGDVAEALVSVRHANCEMVSTIQVRYRCTKKVANLGCEFFGLILDEILVFLRLPNMRRRTKQEKSLNLDAEPI